MAGRSDDEVVAAARRGDPDAWRRLHALHARRLTVWLASLPSGDVAVSAEDVAAEAWLVAASRIGEFSGDERDFGGWLVGIARHLLANYRRRAARRRTDPVERIAEAVDAPGVTASFEAAVAEQEATRRILARLSPREAEVIACLEVIGLDVAATARALDMSSTAVRVARHRGLQRLRRLVDSGELRLPDPGG